MDIVDAGIMRTLVDTQADPCISIYLPTHRAGRETRQGPIRFGNLLDRARADLVATGWRDPEAADLLRAARELTQDEAFWQHQEEGLAVFTAAETLHTFRLPANFAELVVVADAYHVKPLWPVVAGDERYYLLALSRNEVRLLSGDRFRITEVHLPEDIPQSLAEALWFDDPEKQLQHHGALRVGRGRVVARFHGHGVPDERDDAKLDMFLRAVDRGVRDLIDPRAPLLLAGVEELAHKYRKISEHPAVVEEIVAGNPEELAPRQLQHRALPIVEPLLQASRAADAEAFREAGAGREATLSGAATAALEGRVASIFLPLGVQQWGRVVPEEARVEEHPSRQPGDRDLLDLAGVAVWSAGGRVHAVPPDEVPGDGPVAAVLRY